MIPSSRNDRNAPLRILFVVRALTVGGAERQLVLLAVGLQRDGHDVTLCTAYTGGALADELRGTGVRQIELGQRSRADFPRMIWTLRQAISQLRPDIVHGYLPTSNTLAALATPRRAAAIVWGVRASDMRWAVYGRAHQLAFSITRRLAKRPDLIIANSDAGARFHLEQGFPAGSMLVIPNGIDTDRFIPDPAIRRERRAAWGVSPDTPLIGMVARLDPMKDHVALIEAVEILVRCGHRLDVVCVGEGPAAYTAMLRARAKSAGIESIVRWIPPGGDAAALYPAFDVAVSCSRFGEGFSNALGEAMSCGVPCVSTDVGDARQIVGDTGRVVPAGSSTALADALGGMLGEDLVQAGARARQRIVTEFGVSRLLTRTVDALTEVRDRHARRWR